MTIREHYRKFREELHTIYGEGEAAIITDWVYEHTVQLSRTEVVMYPNRLLTFSELAALTSALEMLLLHKPVQYVIGAAWFCNLKLAVNESVLIPRPETEELVQLIVEETKLTWEARAVTQTAPTTLTLLDIGTGSGCIAITLKHQLPFATVHAIDVSTAALKVAGANAHQHNTKIALTEMNFLDDEQWSRLPVFDVIVSNPPYIPLSEGQLLERNVMDYEPHEALFVPDERPLLFYEQIALFGLSHLAKNGKIYVEIHATLALATAQVFQENYLVSTKNDLTGKQRMLVMQRKYIG